MSWHSEGKLLVYLQDNSLFPSWFKRQWIHSHWVGCELSPYTSAALNHLVLPFIMTFNYGNHQEKSPEGLGLIAGFLSQLWITSPQEGWTPIMWGSQLTALPVKHPKCNPHEWKVKEKPPFDFIEMKKNVSPSVSLSDHSSLSTAGLAWGKVNLFLKAEGDGTEFPVTCPNLMLILSNLTWWKLMWCSLFALDWNFCPPYTLCSAAAACERQEVKRAGEVVCAPRSAPLRAWGAY